MTHDVNKILVYNTLQFQSRGAEVIILEENRNVVTTAFSIESKRPDQQSETPSPETKNEAVLKQRLENYKLASMFDPAGESGSELARMQEEILDTHQGQFAGINGLSNGLTLPSSIF